MAHDSRIWVNSKNHILAHFDQVFVHIWRGADTLSGYGQSAPPIIRHILSRHAAFVVLMVIEPETAVPTEAARRELAQTNVPFETKVLGTALVAEGGIMRQALVRSITTTVRLIRPGNGSPIETFGQVSQACAAITKWHAQVSDGADLSAFMQTLH